MTEDEMITKMDMLVSMPDWMWIVTILSVIGSIAYISIHNWRNR